MDASAIGAMFVAVLAAMGGLIKLVLDALGRQDDRHTAAIERMQERQEKFLGNHMSGNTRALNDLVEVVGQLVEEVHSGREES